VVVDTSALLAIYFNEQPALWVIAQLESAPTVPVMSTVNLAECLILLRDRNPKGFSELEDRLLSEPLQFVPPSSSQAQVAADARGRYPLNLGDCFAYTLAKERGEPLITLDVDFRRTDIEVLLPPV
jgi:ribonuclease VapC